MTFLAGAYHLIQWQNMKRNQNRNRRFRRELIPFTEALLMHLLAGYDLSYSWREALTSVQGELSRELLHWLHPPEDSLPKHLLKLAEQYPIEGHRLWFATLRDLYSSGAGLAPAVGAMSAFLRKEHEAALDEHCRALPTKVNVLLLLFFLPPTFLLLFTPLIWELLHAIAVD